MTELWDAVELCRLMVADPTLWRAHFVTAYAGTLGVRERLSLHGVAESCVWVGSDATKERVASIDWTNKTIVEHRADQFWARLQELVGRDAD